MSNARQEVIRYGLTVFLSNAIGLICIFGVAYLWGVVQTTLVIVLVLFLLRPSAGGAHCSSPFNCNLLGAVILPFLGFLVNMLLFLPPDYIYIFTAIAFAVGLSGILKSAPYYTQVKPRVTERRSELKRRSIILAVFLMVFSTVFLLRGHESLGLSIAAGVFWQGLILLRPGIKGVKNFDLIVSRIIR